MTPESDAYTKETLDFLSEFEEPDSQPSLLQGRKVVELAFPIQNQCSLLPSGLNGDQEPPQASRIRISIKLDARGGCGGHAWPAGETLASYLVRRGTGLLQGKRVLELGSGTGLVGLAVGKLGANVYVTDQMPMLSLMEENIGINSLEGVVQAMELNWGTPVVPILRECDIVLAADCVYYEPAFPLLVETLRQVVGSGTEALFCYAKRRKADKRFFAMLKKHFTWEEISADLDKPSDSPAPIYLYRLTKKE